MQVAAWIACVLISATAASAQAQIAFCDLLRNPAAYNGKKVVVRATYRYGFEWQQLYCLNCLEKGKAWLEIPSDLDDESERVLKRAPKSAGIVNITVRGTFMSGGNVGHMNGYPYKLVADRVSDIAVLSKGMKTPAVEKKAEQKWACGGTNPR